MGMPAKPILSKPTGCDDFVNRFYHSIFSILLFEPFLIPTGRFWQTNKTGSDWFSRFSQKPSGFINHGPSFRTGFDHFVNHGPAFVCYRVATQTPSSQHNSNAASTLRPERDTSLVATLGWFGIPSASNFDGR
jgi:hypothetical protein